MRRLAAYLCLALPLALPAGAAASPGGAPPVPAPSAMAVKCKANCAGEGVARRGSRVVVKGSQLADVVTVTFSGSATAKPRSASDRRLLVRVPRGAMTGSLVLTDSFGQASSPSPELQVLRPAALKLTSGPIATTVTGRRAFVDGSRRPTLSYRLQTDEPLRVTVNIVDQATQMVVQSYDEGVVEPGSARAVAWDGRTVLGEQAGEGRYAFIVSGTSESGGTTASTARSDADVFVLLGHIFPIRGRHSYGDGFGAGREHQGVDVFARCGTPLVAARGGTVKIEKFDGRAGHYVVIDEAQSGVDSVYMHLREAALVAKGERVRTGDPIGFVGDTGRASGCHLHFELWSAPGWYTGGKPFDPLSDLKAWDALS